MAKVVGLLATSHGPLLALDPPMWMERARTEILNPAPIFNRLDGRFQTYAELLADVGPRCGDIASLDLFGAQHATAIRALTHIRDTLREWRPDLVLMIGNDQDELFAAGNSPAIAIYTGEDIVMYARDVSDQPEWRQKVSVGYAMDTPSRYPGAPIEARQLVEALVDAGFDLATVSGVPDPYDRGFGHAYGFVFRQLFGDTPPPTVPVLLNTFTPPNVPRIGRCIALGRALRTALEDLPGDQRVVVIATGGLSHFVVEEEFDRTVMSAMLSGDLGPLLSLPDKGMTSGTSETRSWLVLAGMLDCFTATWSEYIAHRRSPPGTGIGMGFATWA